MKILFTSVGRRVELIQAFKNVAERLKIELIYMELILQVRLQHCNFVMKG